MAVFSLLDSGMDGDTYNVNQNNMASEKLMKFSKRKRFKYLDWLRSLAIIGVVFVHTFDPFDSKFLWSNAITPFQIVIAGLVRFCVPMFVMISGALLLDKTDDVISFYIKRTSKVLLPLIFWSLLFILWLFKTQENFILYDVLFKLIIFGQPYYLIFVLLGLYIATPFLRTMIRSLSKNELIGVTLFCFVVSSFHWMLQEWLIAPRNILPNFSISYFVQFLGYFLAGFLLKKHTDKSINPWNISLMTVTYLFTIISTMFLTSLYGASHKGLIFWGYLSPNIAIYSICFFIFIKQFSIKFSSTNSLNSLMKTISLHSFGIYFIHQYLIDLLTTRATISSIVPSTSIIIFLIALIGSLALSVVGGRLHFLRKTLGI
jgi:surface polysaccharide O-acyltransferase-like enzyme